MHNKVEPDNPPLNKVSREREKVLQRKEGLIDASISNSAKFEGVRVLSISTFVKGGYMAPQSISLYYLLFG